MNKELLRKSGLRIAKKLNNRETLTPENLSDYCTINGAVSRRFLFAVGVFVLAILLAIAIGLAERFFGFPAGNLAIWIALLGALLSLGMVTSQDSYHCWEIEERLYCCHCYNLFGAKDVKEILESDCCPFCGGLNPIILLGFKRLEPAKTRACLADGKSSECQREAMSEVEFRDHIRSIQNKYQKRESIQITIFIIGLVLAPIIIAVSASILKGLLFSTTLFASLAIGCLLVW